MTRTGLNRLRYSSVIEPAPSRFTGTSVYSDWAARADAWAAGYTIDAPPHVLATGYYQQLLAKRLESGLIPEGATSGILAGAYGWRLA